MHLLVKSWNLVENKGDGKVLKNRVVRAALVAALGQPQGLPLQRGAKTQFFHMFWVLGARDWKSCGQTAEDGSIQNSHSPIHYSQLPHPACDV
jgi:hypothetical protein